MRVIPWIYNRLHVDIKFKWWAGFYIMMRPICTVVRRLLESPPINHLSQWRICASVNRISIGSGNGLPPVWRQTITWINTDLVSILPLRKNHSEILMKIQNFSFMKMNLKMSSANGSHFVWGDDLKHEFGSCKVVLHNCRKMLWMVTTH